MQLKYPKDLRGFKKCFGHFVVCCIVKLLSLQALERMKSQTCSDVKIFKEFKVQIYSKDVKC